MEGKKDKLRWSLADGGETVVVSGLEREAAYLSSRKDDEARLKKELKASTSAFRAKSLEIAGSVHSMGGVIPKRLSFAIEGDAARSILVSLKDPSTPTGRKKLSALEVNMAKAARLSNEIEVHAGDPTPARLVIEGEAAKEALAILTTNDFVGEIDYQEPTEGESIYRLREESIPKLMKLAAKGDDQKARTAALLLTKGLATPSVGMGR